MNEDLRRAFEETHYIVRHQPAFTLRIGQHSPQLDALLQDAGHDCAAFVTAWNPKSQALSEAENRTRQQALLDDLKRLGPTWIGGIGQHPDNGWPGEESVLVLGLAFDAACNLARQHGQLAFVWCVTGKPCQLIMTPPPPAARLPYHLTEAEIEDLRQDMRQAKAVLDARKVASKG